MPNYANSRDKLMCEPPDTSVEDALRDDRIEDAFNVWIETGDLPCGMDTSTVDEEFLEEPESLDAMQRAWHEGDHALMAEMAAKVCSERAEIAIRLIAENIE